MDSVWLLQVEKPGWRGLIPWLANAEPYPEAQVLVTVVISVSLLAFRRGAHGWADNHGWDVSELLVSGVIALVSTLGIVILIGTWGLTNELNNAYGDLDLTTQIPKVALAFILIGAAYALTGFIGRLIQRFAGSSDITEHQRELIYRLTQVSIYSLVGLVVIGLLTENVGNLLVGAGFLGIVVGMAARQTLGSVLAGFVLMFSRPFEIGDWIEIGDNEGIVTHVSIVSTRLQTFDGEYVMIPNDDVSAKAIVNRTRKGRLRIEVDVGIDYDADADYAAEVALEAVKDLDDVLSVPSPQVVFKEFGESGIILGVRAWIDNPSARRKWRTRTAVISAVKSGYEEEDINIPFPVRELMGRGPAGGFELAGESRSVRANASTDGGESGGQRENSEDESR
ncbi:mechanosensitive ion channel family protein [Haloprofundus salinisoli]|uniref:mechanosensitive ion channel family protein n=1 Tax=Haloprofundus salinisoli TaxID=2876193 RepID=UPI001CCBD3D3|nr:mechanosensitive ion channel family protein [Haloprofundus salinisoli]